MAIRIRHDAAALGLNLANSGEGRRKYGQQLVMQQRKYDMDQLSAMQDRAFDMQKQQMQNAWQEDRDFKNDLLSRMRQEQEQDFRAKQVKDARDFELQDRDIQNRTKAFDQGRSQVTAMAMNALESGQLPTDVAKNLRDLVAANTSVAYSPQWDDETREQFIPQYNAQVSALLEQAGPPKSQAQIANQGLRYFDPRVGEYAEKFEPGVGMEIYDPDTKMRWKDAPPQPQVSPFQSYYQENPNQFKKDLAEQMAALSEKVDSGEMRFFESEDALRQAALERMQNEFNFQQNALGMGQSLPAGQAAPAQSSTAPMSPQGTPAAPPVRTVSPAVMQTVGNVLNTFPDTEMMATSQLGREALVQNGFPQGQAQAPTTPIAPPMAMPTDRAGMIAAGMPQGTASSSAAASSVGASTSPQPFSISEAAKVFETGDQKQKTQMRDKLSDARMASDLIAQAALNNPEAIKVLDMLEKSFTPSEIVSAAQKRAKEGKVNDAIEVVADLRMRRERGDIDDVDFASAVVENSGKTAKQMYQEIKGSKFPGGKIPKGRMGMEMEQGVLNELWADMGMDGSQQGNVKMIQVIEHAMKQGGMDRQQAEDYVYNQILARKYGDDLQRRFEAEITSGLQSRKVQEKRDSWTPFSG
jgi:hypothetical protein